MSESRPEFERESREAKARAEELQPSRLEERVAAFLFYCDFLGEWGSMADFWFEENGEDYRERANRILEMVRAAGPNALERLN